NNLKVTSYDVARVVERLFSEKPVDEATPEERIDTMISEEVVNQGAVRHPADHVADGSAPVDALDLNIVTRPRFDLSEFWSNAGVESTSGPAGERSATVRAIEGARTPDELLEMLEGGVEPLLEASAPSPRPARSDGRMRWVALVVAALVAAAAVIYAVFPGVFGAAESPPQTQAPSGPASD
ncbi:MAG: hypothetical protein QF464_22400, partial [Myxococcota bacterium]|nr:hypothetical protein [Myxococcota bacterium]